jgi:hypothetical protein
MSFSMRRGMPTLDACQETKETSLSDQRRQNTSRKSTVEMDFPKTMKHVEMEFSKHKTIKRQEIDFSTTMYEPVEQVNDMEVVIMTPLTMR